jgi:ribosomal protein L11 methyltransferase
MKPKPSWLEVSLIVEAELVEPVSEVLARFAPDGVVVESTAVSAAMDDSEGRAVGPLRVAAYLPVDETLEDKRRRLEESLWYLGRIRPLPAASFQVIEQADWSESWKQHYHPIRIGERLVIVPAWLENPHPERIPIRIDPGMAFGTGTHPTTQLCLEFVEEYLTSGQSVIDLGCGTAILAIAALKLGAEQALGVDIDPQAVQAAQENAADNGVIERLELEVGSLREVLDGRFGLRQADLVLANILAPVLARLLGEGLGELLSPGGVLVLSGILAEQAGEVQAAMEASGLRLIEVRQMGDWVALAGAFIVRLSEVEA